MVAGSLATSATIRNESVSASQYDEGRDDYLRRLPAEQYQGEAYVHWTMTIEDRKQGWLIPVFYYKLREILAHTTFRYGLCCPMFCLMPDHMHFLWVGILQGTDQRHACKYFRKQMNSILEKLGICFQKQPFDHVLTEKERERGAFEAIAEYIARNPERASLVRTDAFRTYPYTHCLVPGYPELNPWQSDYWERFWRAYSYLRDHGLMRMIGESSSKSRQTRRG